MAPTAPLTELALRCGSCGASYQGPAAGEILTCAYCGSSQRVVDARAFLDHFRAQIAAFVQQAIPVGLDAGGGGNVDPVARLAAFNGGVRPRLTSESESYRFGLFNLLSKPFVILPFSGEAPLGTASPASVSLFSEKVNAVSGLAVDAPSKELVTRSGSVATAYQTLLVASGLLRDRRPERFPLLVQNFRSAGEAMGRVPRWSAVGSRLTALARQAAAADALRSGASPSSLRESLEKLGRDLDQTLALHRASPELGFLVPAIEQELAAVRQLASMVTIVESSPAVRPEPLVFLERLSGVLDWISNATPPDWGATFRTARFREEIFLRAAQLRAAQGGRGLVHAASLGGGTLVPFWTLQLAYTFETGVLWSKRGKEVPELLLIAATFPSDPTCLGGPRVTSVATDVFGGFGRAGSRSPVFDRLSGREQSITDGGPVRALLQGAVPTPIAGRPAVPPLSTAREAQRIAQAYVESVRGTNASAAAQLRGSAVEVGELVYVPVPDPARPPIPWLGSLSPASIGDPNVLSGLFA